MKVSGNPRLLSRKYRPQQKQIIDWGLKTLNVPSAWTLSKGEGVKVAVLDTGVDHRHPDLVNNIECMANFTSDTRCAMDFSGHGTHTAGIVAAEDNGIGVVGVAPKARLYIAKVLGDDKGGTFESVTNGVYWSIDNGVDIISMSLGAPIYDEGLHNAIKEAYEKNITVVAAAGNNGFMDGEVDYPAKYDEVISVGSINQDYSLSGYSSAGKIEVVAPGNNIYSTYPGNSYAILSGTSMACPFISGVLALMIGKHKKTPFNHTPIDTPEQIREHLIRTADDYGMIGRDDYFGYGLVSPNLIMEDLHV